MPLTAMSGSPGIRYLESRCCLCHRLSMRCGGRHIASGARLKCYDARTGGQIIERNFKAHGLMRSGTGAQTASQAMYDRLAGHDLDEYSSRLPARRKTQRDSAYLYIRVTIDFDAMTC